MAAILARMRSRFRPTPGGEWQRDSFLHDPINEPKPSACHAAMGRIRFGCLGADKLCVREHERLREH